MSTKKFGNISFEVESFSNCTWGDFREQFRGKLQGYDIGECYKALTGRDPVIDATIQPVKEKKGGKARKPDKDV